MKVSRAESNGRPLPLPSHFRLILGWLGQGSGSTMDAGKGKVGVVAVDRCGRSLRTLFLRRQMLCTVYNDRIQES